MIEDIKRELRNAIFFLFFSLLLSLSLSPFRFLRPMAAPRDSPALRWSRALSLGVWRRLAFSSILGRLQKMFAACEMVFSCKKKLVLFVKLSLNYGRSLLDVRIISIHHLDHFEGMLSSREVVFLAFFFFFLFESLFS